MPSTVSIETTAPSFWHVLPIIILEDSFLITRGIGALLAFVLLMLVLPYYLLVSYIVPDWAHDDLLIAMTLMVVVPLTRSIGSAKLKKHDHAADLAKNSEDDAAPLQAVDSKDGRRGHKLPLTATEPHLAEVPACNLVSIFSLTEKEDIQKVIDFVTKRTARLVEKNKWLVGRLQTEKDEKRDPQFASAYLWVPERAPELDKDPLFRVVEVKTRDEALNLNPNLKLAAPCGKGCMNKPDCPPAKITLVVYRGGTGSPAFALCVSVSHMIADAATVYGVLESFNYSCDDAKELIAKRWNRKAQFIPTSLGAEANRKMWYWMLSSRNGPLQMLMNGGRKVLENLREDAVQAAKRNEKLPEDSPLRCYHYSYTINPRWIDAEKQKWSCKTEQSNNDPTIRKNSPFLSTNDILCSWLFTNFSPKIAAGYIVYDKRGRRPGLGINHAGNYGELLGFYPEEFKDPRNIRTAVGSGGELNLAWSAKPQTYTQPGGSRITGTITNWVQFYRTVRPFPEELAKRVQHLDTYPVGGGVDPDALPLHQPVAAIWRRNEDGNLGVFIATDEPLAKEFDPRAQSGSGEPTTPFHKEILYNIQEGVDLGIHVNTFAK